MKISSRFSIAVHIVLILVFLGDRQKQTSDFLSSCIFVNPVVIRRILGQLKKAGIVDIKPGEGGATLLINPSDLSLFDIYQAVESCETLFNSHKEPTQKCLVNCFACSKSQECLESNDSNLNDLDSNDLDSDDFDSNDFDSNDFDSNDFDSNDFDSNDFDSNDFDSNDFDSDDSESDDSESEESCSVKKICFIHANIESHLQSAQKAMEESLKSTTVQQIISELKCLEPKN
ncbi:MAG: Rrf2 family transcriptional regulator [Methanimicrococcus sp.]|nr:Rrf2 family transcriptional regulator [Methanimicrococcus sp.]